MNNGDSLSLEFQNKVKLSFNKNKLFIFEITVADLDFDQNICEFADKYYSSHALIFNNNYSIGGLAITRLKNNYFRIVLLMA